MVDALEQPEQRQAVLQLVVDGLLQHGEEFVECALQRLTRALRVGHAEDRRRDCAQSGGRAGRRLEHASGGEHRVNVVEGRGQGCRGQRSYLRELAASPVHYNQDTIFSTSACCSEAER